MQKTFQTPATLEGISSLKDGGVTIRFHTQELSAQEKAIAFNYQGQFGWILFKATEHNTDDIKELEAVRKDIGGKSPSQRLRSVLYVLYTQKGDESISFEQFYIKQIEKVIEAIKARLN